MSLVIGRLKDKSSNVRKAAIKFLARSIEQAPYTCIAEDKGTLCLSYFESKRLKLEDSLKVMILLVLIVRLNVHRLKKLLWRMKKIVRM
jgi:hypothetical protein